MNLNGRLKAVEQAISGPTGLAEVLIMADGAIGLYRAGRLVKDLGATLARIYGHELATPAPERASPAGPETFQELLARVWGEG